MIFNRQLYKQKPSAWGPVSNVQASIFKNAERIGIDPASIALAMPLWERAGFTAYDYSKNQANGLLTAGITWTQDNVSFTSSNYINITSSTIINLPATKKISALFKCTQTQKSTIGAYYAFFSWGGTDDFIIYPYDALDNRGYRLFWRDVSLSIYEGGSADFSNVSQTLAFSAEEGNQRIYRYGKLLASGSQSLSNAGPFNSFRIGSWADGTQQFYGLGSFVYLFSEILQPTQIAYLSDNPYYLLHRVAPVFYSVPGGGVLPTFNPLFLNAAQPTRVIQ